MRDISGDKAWLVEALGASSIVERDRLAAFVRDPSATFAANPFPSATAGAARQRWGLREIEFEAMQVAAAGLPCLLTALALLPPGELLRQEILRTPVHVLYLLHQEGDGRIVGAVLHGKPREALPAFTPAARSATVPPVVPERSVIRRVSRRRVDARQLDLFAT
ncbi:hypothetical protein [Methylobacterium sp. ap11]|uniref:hypothetical protein n=1 Tax=Methylobacterium sp. ap11 TaxID=1761799 RepID=UPI0015A55508|nr:hypothetical protein [Methylobacterium sp. ap11]